MAHQVKPVPTRCQPIRVPMQVLAAQLSVHLPASEPEKARESGLRDQIPVIHVGGPDGVPDSRLGPVPALTVTAIQGMNEQMQNLSVSRSLSIFPSLGKCDFKINKYIYIY